LKYFIAEEVRIPTRCPLLHKYFGGWKGWKKALKIKMDKIGVMEWSCFMRLFGRLCWIDYGTNLIWWIPRIESSVRDDDDKIIRIGWLNVAFVIRKGFWYPSPSMRGDNSC